MRVWCMATLLTCAQEAGLDDVAPNTVSAKKAAIGTAISDFGILSRLFVPILDPDQA